MQPRPLTQIRTIEITSRCNLACGYCLHPQMARPKVDMTDEIWAASLAWVRYFVAKGTQGEVNLSGVGEPTLHPQLSQWCVELRDMLGPSRPILFTTNGRSLTADLVERLKLSRPRVCVTAHHAHLAGPAAALLQSAGLLRYLSFDPVLYPQDWAGQVVWAHPPQARTACAILKYGLGSITADGLFQTCCMDGCHERIIGRATDEPGTPLRLADWRLCPTCWQRPPEDLEIASC